MVLLGGCGSAEGPPGTSLERLSLVSHKALNHNTAVRVHLVCVYDKKLLDKLKAMNSGDYFSSVAQLKRDNPKNLSLFHFEMIPAQVLEDYTPALTRASDVWGILLFVDYHGKGSHRTAIKSDFEHARVVLGKSDIKTVENVEDQTVTGKESLTLYPTDSLETLDKTASFEKAAAA